MSKKNQSCEWSWENLWSRERTEVIISTSSPSGQFASILSFISHPPPVLHSALITPLLIYTVGSTSFKNHTKESTYISVRNSFFLVQGSPLLYILGENIVEIFDTSKKDFIYNIFEATAPRYAFPFSC